jgi:hypothetical protein
VQHQVAILRAQMGRMDRMREQVKAQPDEQLSPTDPDSRSMMLQAKGTGVVGYNMQTAVEAKHLLMVGHAPHPLRRAVRLGFSTRAAKALKGSEAHENDERTPRAGGGWQPRTGPRRGPRAGG